MIKGIFFDFYDTLCYIDDEIYLEGKKRMIAEFNVTLEMFFEAWRSTAKESLIGKLENSEARVKAVAEKLQVELADEKLHELAEMDRDYLLKGSGLYPGTIETITKIKELGLKLGIISNASDTVDVLAKKYKLEEYFDVINFSYKLGIRKPSKEIYESALDALELKASESIFMGDGNDHELDTAFDLGFKTILIEQDRNDRFRNADSTRYHHKIKNISEIIQIINEDKK